MRRFLPGYLTFLVLAAVLVAPGAMAQFGQCTEPNVSLRLTSSGFQPGEARTGALSITNPNPRDAEAEVRLEAPAGWDASVAQSTVAVPAENTTHLDVTVVAPPEGSGVSRGDVAARVTLTCMVLNDASPQVESTSAVQMEQGGWPWVAVLAGGVALVGGTAGAVAFRNRRLSVELACHRPLLPVEPGGRVSFPVAVANRRSEPDTVQLRVLDVPAGWRGFVAVPEVELDAREERELWLMVGAPEDAELGEQATITLEAVPVRGDRGHRLAVGAEVVSNVDSGPGAADTEERGGGGAEVVSDSDSAPGAADTEGRGGGGAEVVSNVDSGPGAADTEERGGGGDAVVPEGEAPDDGDDASPGEPAARDDASS